MYLRANLSAQKPITKLARVKRTLKRVLIQSMIVWTTKIIPRSVTNELDSFKLKHLSSLK
jgi:hypothetical protein